MKVLLVSAAAQTSGAGECDKDSLRPSPFTKWAGVDTGPVAGTNLPVGWARSLERRREQRTTVAGAPGSTERPLRVGNCSGFYGDRLAAMHEMLSGGDLDYLTGDYLAELTMLILGRDRMKSPDRGYARSFLTQLEQCLGTAADRGVRIVVNAGGLNPAGLAQAVRALAHTLDIPVKVAHVEGDDLLPRATELDLGSPLTANAYLGAWGIVECLNSGAVIVNFGQGEAGVAEVWDLGEEGVIAAGGLSAAFDDVPGHHRSGQSVIVVPGPAEVCGSRPDHYGRIGDPAGDHDVGTGVQALDDAPRAQVGVGR